MTDRTTGAGGTLTTIRRRRTPGGLPTGGTGHAAGAWSRAASPGAAP